ncbi:hypothetical protein SNEBB_008016 [Seison nebaliae]|nr:hypothetical protein SNEBB_008016 [Seison nebaliae]
MEPSVHLVLPSIIEVQHKLKKLERIYPLEINHLLDDINERFGYLMDECREDFAEIYAISTFLHPLMQCSLEDCPKINIKKQLGNYITENIISSSSNESINHDWSNLEDDYISKLSKRKLEKKRNNNADLEDEVDAFGKETMNENETLLEYWIKQKLKFPLLDQIVEKTFSFPATSAASERIFSRASYQRDLF